MSRGMAAKGRLEDVFRTVAAAELRRPLREWLLSVAVEAAVREPSGRDFDAVAEQQVVLQGADAIPLLEGSIAAVGRLTGSVGRRLQVSEAKELLKAFYGEAGTALAARLSRLSKHRNTAAHPDVGLPDDIAACAGLVGTLLSQHAVEEPLVMQASVASLTAKVDRMLQTVVELAAVVELLVGQVQRLELAAERDGLDLWLAEVVPTGAADVADGDAAAGLCCAGGACLAQEPVQKQVEFQLDQHRRAAEALDQQGALSEQQRREAVALDQ